MAKPRPLAGKRVVVTRRIEEAEVAAQMLRAAGAEAVLLPSIRLERLLHESLTEQKSHIASCDWLVFVSSAAVDCFADLFAGQIDARLAAIGPATARRLQARLGKQAWLPQHFRGSALGETLPVNRGARVMVVGPLERDPELADALEQRGIVVEELALYATRTASLLPDFAKQIARGVDVVTFASPSAVRGFGELLEISALPAALAGVTIGCIGETTAQAARACGYTVDVVARRHTFPDLIAALETFFENTKS